MQLKPMSQTKTDIGAGGMAQSVEHLPSKCEALSSKPNAPKKKIPDFCLAE
jgi:hypothetical protein